MVENSCEQVCNLPLYNPIYIFSSVVVLKAEGNTVAAVTHAVQYER